MSISQNIRYNSKEIEKFYKNNRIKWDDFYPSEKFIFEKLNFSRESKVLDIGCGCGGLGNALNEKFGVEHYTGVDIHEQSIETAKSLFPKAEFINSDILTHNFINDSFDFVISLGCVDWNIEFHSMLTTAFKYVKPGGYFISSFRLTNKSSVKSIKDSHQFINFDGKLEGEKAPYIVFNVNELISEILSFKPSKISAFGYWGSPSKTAVTPFEKVCFAVFCIQKKDGVNKCNFELHLPADLNCSYGI
jgi:ubiquinone/menaquinone biosynthesis C-methylase UbiE